MSTLLFFSLSCDSGIQKSFSWIFGSDSLTKVSIGHPSQEDQLLRWPYHSHAWYHSSLVLFDLSPHPLTALPSLNIALRFLAPSHSTVILRQLHFSRTGLLPKDRRAEAHRPVGLCLELAQSHFCHILFVEAVQCLVTGQWHRIYCLMEELQSHTEEGHVPYWGHL